MIDMHSLKNPNAGAILTVDLDAIRANYRLLRQRGGGATCAGVLKADAYGLGLAPVARALLREGCQVFFTAHAEEGARLRQLVPAHCTIYVLHGFMPGGAPEFIAHGLIPVLNDPGQISEWQQLARQLGRALPAALQFDTGMSRMGLAPADYARLQQDSDWLAGVDVRLVMSHLACADETNHALTDAQRQRFVQIRAQFPTAAASLANSSAVFISPDYHFDVMRPGAALYGINPQPGSSNLLQQAVSLHARVVQLRSVEDSAVVGYGARFIASGTRRIATIGIGYADGWLRSLSNRGRAFVDQIALPIAGTVSMDSITLDATALPEGRLAPGDLVELLGTHQHVDQVASDAGTIGYELLTRLGQRFERRYIGDAPVAN